MKTKHEMPDELRCNSEHWLRETMVMLRNFKGVSIEWEEDSKMTQAFGEATGEWRVYITAAGTDGRYRTFESKDEDVEPALYDAFTQAEKSEDEWYDNCRKAKEAALAKLTPEERRILHVA